MIKAILTRYLVNYHYLFNIHSTFLLLQFLLFLVYDTMLAIPPLQFDRLPDILCKKILISLYIRYKTVVFGQFSDYRCFYNAGSMKHITYIFYISLFYLPLIAID